MKINVEYKIINPILEYSKPDKMILIMTQHKRKRHYLRIGNPLKDKFKKTSSFFIMQDLSYKKKEVKKLHYKEPEAYFIFINKVYTKKFDLDFYISDLLGKFTIIDYFYTRNIKYLDYELSVTNIDDTCKDLVPLDIVLIRDYNPNQKYSLFTLNYNEADIKFKEIKKCIFNIRNILNNEELYLDFKENHDLVEIEEDTDLICIIDNKEYYKSSY